ncbi:MAG: hypothetical protein ABIH03_15735, partial [Pseudomonadota bacterium]
SAAARRSPLHEQDMNPKSASTLVWASVIAILLGMVILSPSAAFVLYVVAVVFATIPTAFGPKVPRVAGGVALLVALALAYQGYPAFAAERDSYRKRAESKAAKATVKSPAPQQK